MGIALVAKFTLLMCMYHISSPERLYSLLCSGSVVSRLKLDLTELCTRGITGVLVSVAGY